MRFFQCLSEGFFQKWESALNPYIFTCSYLHVFMTSHQFLCVTAIVCKSVGAVKNLCVKSQWCVRRVCVYEHACMQKCLSQLFFLCLLRFMFLFFFLQILHMYLLFTTCLHPVSLFSASSHISSFMFHAVRSCFMLLDLQTHTSDNI